MVEKDYLGAWDLVVGKDGAPKDYTLTIAAVKSVALKSREAPKGKRKVVISFLEARKAMVGNTTNCETIESLYGPDTDAWVGKLITLYQTDVRSPKGGTIRGIRVRPKKPTGAATERIEERPVDEAMRAAQDEAFNREPGSDDA
jgi:hypothetical protein